MASVSLLIFFSLLIFRFIASDFRLVALACTFGVARKKLLNYQPCCDSVLFSPELDFKDLKHGCSSVCQSLHSSIVNIYPQFSG